LRIGVPKEIKNNEHRASINPGGAYELIEMGHEIIIQNNAGTGSGYSNEDYSKIGCLVKKDIREIYEEAELIVKVKEPIEPEYNLIRDDHIIFTYLHLSSNKKLVEILLNSRATCIAYETIEKDGRYPLLAPMSEVAGREAVIFGAYYLGIQFGGEGLLIGGISGVPRGRVLILGAGIAAKSAAKMASGLGADVVIMSLFIEELREIELGNYFSSNVSTRIMSQFNILDELKKSDIVISAIYVKGGRTPILVTKEMLKVMKKGAVIVAIDIDQGSSIETARPTTHLDPIYIEEEIIHYCVVNMPGIYSKTSTLALTSLTLPYIKKIANGGKEFVLKDKEFRTGLNLYNGKIVYKKVAEDLDMVKKYYELVN